MKQRPAQILGGEAGKALTSWWLGSEGRPGRRRSAVPSGFLLGPGCCVAGRGGGAGLQSLCVCAAGLMGGLRFPPGLQQRSACLVPGRLSLLKARLERGKGNSNVNLTPTRRSPAPGNGKLLEGMSGNFPPHSGAGLGPCWGVGGIFVDRLAV